MADRLDAPDRDGHTRDRLTMITELRDAIDGGQLVLHYQPLVHLASGRVRAVEAPVRWRHPTRGLVAPDVFIPLAEQTGVMRPLTLRSSTTRWTSCGPRATRTASS